MSADSHHNSSLLVHFHDLQGQYPKHIIDAFTRANSGPFTYAIATSLGALSHVDLRGLTEWPTNTLSDRAFRNQFLCATMQHIKDHPYQTAFLVNGIILMMNPFTMVGFGPLGPVPGEYLPSVCVVID
jgi:hypothetical protein